MKPFKDKSKGGRPTKYKKKYCKMLIDHMAKGLSFECFGASIDVAGSTVFKWVHDFPEFSEAKEIAFEKSRLFWEKQGRAGLWQAENAPKFNSTVWVFNMKNRFRWGERTEQQINVTEKPDELLKKIPRAELYKLLKEREEQQNDEE